MASSSAQPPHKCPFILACGYRRIQSPKTALTFPAWLVQLSPDRSCWRSKKDFLLLFRATKGCHRIRVQCPKSALNKLAEKAPWKRQATQPTTRTDLAVPVEHDQTPIHPNNYEASMTKNIHLLDTYLRSLATQCGEHDLSFSKAWSHFSRPQDTDGLMPMGWSKETSSLVIVPSIQSPKHDTVCSQDNLQELARRGETRLIVGSQQEQQLHDAAIRSCKLGQYFCSPATAQQIVHLTLKFVGRQLKAANRVQETIVFLEPSCGHGDIVRQLLQDLESTNIVGDNFHVVACDIDESAIQFCQEHTQQNDHVEWMHGDFLQTTPSGRHGSTTRIVLGGPPYTSGAGSGSLVARDLPLAFFLHCANAWKAAFVAFILPVRYKTRPMQLPGWTVETYALSESSTFFFRGQDGVIQPSIIQCYTRTGSF